MLNAQELYDGWRAGTFEDEVGRKLPGQISTGSSADECRRGSPIARFRATRISSSVPDVIHPSSLGWDASFGRSCVNFTSLGKLLYKSLLTAFDALQHGFIILQLSSYQHKKVL